MRKALLVVGLVGVVAVVVLVGVKVRQACKSAGSTAPQLVVVERGMVRRTVSADGTLRALTTVTVKSDAGGKVMILAVDVGDRVKAGELIAKIDPTNTQADYTQAVAGMQSAQAQLAQARAQADAQPSLTRSSIGQAQAAYEAAVKDLDRLESSTHPRARAAAKAALDKASAALRASREDLARLKAATHPVSRTQARSALDEATAALKQAQENRTRLKQVQHPQALTETQTALDTAKSNLSVAEKELKRSQRLRADGFLSQSALESAENEHEAAKAAFATAQERARTVAEDQAAELRAAQAQVEQAEAAEVSARKAWETIDDDQATELRAAQARVEEAEADLASAERTWSTIDDDQAAERASARAQVTKAENALDNARASAVEDRIRREAVADQRAQFTKAEAQVEQTKTALSYTTITAPREGIILAKYVEEGTIVTSGRSSVAEGMSIVELGDLSTMYVDVEVDEFDLADIDTGQKVEIEVESVADRTFTGSVARVNPQATTTANITTVKVEIEVLDHDERLIPGLSATCDFLAGERSGVLALPIKAVRQREGKSYVLVPGDPNPITVPVEVGLEGDNTVEILSGLNEGDRVLIRQIGAAPSGDRQGGPPGPPGGASDFIRRSP